MLATIKFLFIIMSISSFLTQKFNFKQENSILISFVGINLILYILGLFNILFIGIYIIYIISFISSIFIIYNIINTKNIHRYFTVRKYNLYFSYYTN